MPLEDVPEPPPDWQDELSESDEESSDSDAASASSSSDAARDAEKLAAWRTRKREDLLEDMICDEEPNWNKAALLEDPVAADLVRGLLCKDPKARLSAAEALEHRHGSIEKKNVACVTVASPAALVRQQALVSCIYCTSQ